MNMEVSKSILNGVINVLSCKSYLIRAIICAGLSLGSKNISVYDDVEAAINARRKS